jgi:hypothetical protein
MSFGIKFLAETVEGSELGNTGQYGEIVLGDEREMFLSLIGYWSPRDYEEQWRNGILRVVRERQESCLITSLHDPREADVLMWWLLYPDGDTVRIQNALLLLDQHRQEFSTHHPYASIPPRRIVTDDGQPISEWVLPITDLRDFLQS